MEIFAEKYRIDDAVGQGGFGDVYKGYDLHMSRPVAIKRIGKIDHGEAVILSRLDHKGLPRIYDILTEETDRENTLIVMEWVEGRNLEEYIETNGPLNEEKAAYIGDELLNILKYLHSQSPAIIYQDLKPSNIMVMPDGHIKLIDFGTAFLMTYGDESRITAGTVGYGAPEQRGLTGAYYADERSDIYSWGAVMYTMLSGRILSKPPYTMERIRHVCPQLSFGLERVITKATARNNRKRYDNVAEIQRMMKKRPLIEAGYKVIFLTFMAVCLAPFVIMWCLAYKGGLFAWLQKFISVIYEWWVSSVGLKIDDRIKVLKTVLRLTMSCLGYGQRLILCRETGLLLLASAWMIFGLRHAAVRRYIKVKRSVFLSEKKYPGLWIGALVAGVLFGYGLGQNSAAAVSYAMERTDAKVLPVSLIDTNGNKMLVDYDSVLNVNGDFRIVIDQNSIYEGEKQEVEVMLKNMTTGDVSMRTFFIQ